MVYQNYKGQDYKSLKSECQTNNRLFEDPEFPASDSSLYFSRQPPFTCVWKRPKVRISSDSFKSDPHCNICHGVYFKY